jgi:hypothetical protein
MPELSLPTANSRTIVGLMGVAVVFSVISAEINPKKGTSAFSEPFVIIAGGTIAAALLSLIAEAGDTGRRFGVGLASLACVTAVLVNGKPVWTTVENLVGGKNTGSTGSTTPTTPTQPSAAPGATSTVGGTVPSYEAPTQTRRPLL